MYFCYVDESGDCGMHDPSRPEKTGSSFFILVGLVVAANKWKISLETMKASRKKFNADRIFQKKLSPIGYISKDSDAFGIIRI